MRMNHSFAIVGFITQLSEFSSIALKDEDHVHSHEDSEETHEDVLPETTSIPVFHQRATATRVDYFRIRIDQHVFAATEAHLILKQGEINSAFEFEQR